MKLQIKSSVAPQGFAPPALQLVYVRAKLNSRRINEPRRNLKARCVLSSCWMQMRFHRVQSLFYIFFLKFH